MKVGNPNGQQVWVDAFNVCIYTVFHLCLFFSLFFFSVSDFSVDITFSVLCNWNYYAELYVPERVQVFTRWVSRWVFTWWVCRWVFRWITVLRWMNLQFLFSGRTGTGTCTGVQLNMCYSGNTGVHIMAWLPSCHATAAAGCLQTCDIEVEYDQDRNHDIEGGSVSDLGRQ